MSHSQRTWIVVCFLLELLTGSHSSRLRRQAPDESQDPSLQDLSSLLGQLPAQSLPGNGMDLTNLMDSVSQALGQGAQGMGQGVGQSVGQGMDLSSVMDMANALQQKPERGVRVHFNDGGSEAAMMEVFVETKSVDDLMGSKAGRQQLGQLNAQLEQAMGSLGQGMNMMQGVHQAQQAVDAVNAPNLEAMLSDIARMLSSGGSAGLFPGLAGNDSMNLLLQTMDQLPALKSLMENLSRMLAGLETGQPSTAQTMQQMLASAASSLQGLLGNGRSMPGADGMRQMMEMAVNSLVGNMELLNTLMYSTQHTLSDPSFLQTLNNTHCLMTTLTDPRPNQGLALHCMQQLMQTVLTPQNSEQIMTTMRDFLNTYVNNPQTLQTVMKLLQTPSLDTAFTLLQSFVGQLDVAGSDVTTAMQTVQTMLRGLLQNQPLMEALSKLLQSPESGSLYRDVMDMLRNSTLGDPVTQQLLLVVNDTLVRVWTSGDLGQAADTLRQMTAMLSQAQDPGQPLSQSQLAFLDMLNKVMDMMVSVANRSTTQLPDSSTTARPAITDTPTPRAPPSTTATVRETTSSPGQTTTSSTSTTTARPATPLPPARSSSAAPSPAPATTGRSDTQDDDDDSGAVHLSFSVISVALALFVSTMFL
ncbi:mucin-4-like [Littorina saxatilis]|uniref:mucin-4-like n=1 Tax=Littorina saxatilis TaxID=31220 RepID=UPI0038B45658